MLGLELTRALDAFPLEAWAVDVGFERESRDEWTATCPHCRKERKIVLNVRRRRWHCWVCQRKEERIDRASGLPRTVTVVGGGGLIRLFAWWWGCGTGEAARWVLQVATPGPLAAAPIPELATVAAVIDDEPEDLDPPAPPEGAAPLGEHNLAYLASRGITEPVARAYGLFGCVGGRYDRRVVFPAWGASGGLVYWQARATWSPAEDEARGRGHIKALNPPRAPGTITSEHAVFNLHRAVALGRGRVVLCEGPISAIQAGDDAVCLWGKQLYAGQLRELLRAGVRAVDVMFDGPTDREPDGAWPEAQRLAPLLSFFFERVGLVRIPAGDPGDYSRDDNLSFRATSISASRVSRVLSL